LKTQKSINKYYLREKIFPALVKTIPGVKKLIQIDCPQALILIFYGFLDIHVGFSFPGAE